MKTASEWLDQVGEVVMFSTSAESVEKVIRSIQADAFRHAATLVHRHTDTSVMDIQRRMEAMTQELEQPK